MKVDGNLLALYCYRSSDDADSQNRTKGCRLMRNNFIETKELVKFSLTKTDYRCYLDKVAKMNSHKKARTMPEASSVSSKVQGKINNITSGVEEGIDSFTDCHKLTYARCAGRGNFCM